MIASVFIWAAKPPGIDPTTHFWFEQDGIRYRICDGIRWIEGQEPDNCPDFPVPCGKCKETYLEDLLRGNKRLHLLAESPWPQNATPLRENATPLRENATPLRENVIRYNRTVVQGDQSMIEIPMSLFARFYEARPAAQVRIVRDIRQRLLHPKEYKMRDPYLPIRNFLRSTHWATGNIVTSEDAFEPFMDKQSPNVWKDRFQKIGEKYLAFWNFRDAAYFLVPATNIAIRELSIQVRPEVGLQIGDDFTVLKVWMNTKRPSIQTRQVFGYLMDQARDHNDKWQHHWHTGVWDVLRSNVPQPRRVAHDFETGLRGQAAAFLEIWDELQEQVLNDGE